jgi:hypothetical protein
MYEHPITGEIIPYRIHMADGAGIYGRWHTFIRSSILLGIEEKSWIEIDRLLLAVAYMIHYIPLSLSNPISFLEVILQKIFHPNKQMLGVMKTFIS